MMTDKERKERKEQRERVERMQADSKRIIHALVAQCVDEDLTVRQAIEMLNRAIGEISEMGMHAKLQKQTKTVIKINVLLDGKTIC